MKKYRFFVLTILLIISAVAFYGAIFTIGFFGLIDNSPKCDFVASEQIAFENVISAAKEGKISCAAEQGNAVSLTYVDGTNRIVRTLPGKNFTETLRSNNVTEEQLKAIKYRLVPCAFEDSAVVSFTEIVAAAKELEISCAVGRNDAVSVVFVDGKSNNVKVTPGKDFIETLRFYGVTDEQINAFVYFPGGLPQTGIESYIPSVLFLLVMVGIFIWFIRKMNKGSGGIGGSGKKLEDQNKKMTGSPSAPGATSDGGDTSPIKHITFDDVAGVDEAKAEVKQVVDFLKNPAKFTRLGARMPKGILLVGPPGTGKTLLAKAIAGEAGVPFFTMAGSEFMEMYVGVGASRVRGLFDTARKSAPSIVFIDEIDTIGKKRTAGSIGGEGEHQQTINQLLKEMDGFDQESAVVVLAATNRIDVLDEAILRPGRFDRHVVVDRPDLKGRVEILKVHARGKPFEDDVRMYDIAKQIPGFTGADIANLLNEAAIRAAQDGSQKISRLDIERAKDRIIAGPEKRTLFMTPEEKNIVAHHECGHAVVRYLASVGCMIPTKISIVSRGFALGLTWYIPDRDIVLQRKSELKVELAGTIGGYVAENILLDGDITTGPSNDLEKFTELARRMVARFGMSEQLPTRIFAQDDRSMVSTDSQETKARVDAEIEALIIEAKETAKKVIEENREGFLALVDILMKEETISDEELIVAFIKCFPNHDASKKASEKLAQIYIQNEEQKRLVEENTL